MLICTERKILLCLSLKSCFVENKPIIGSGTNSCFHHMLKGRKLPNKEDITGLKGGHQSCKLNLSLVSLLLEPLEFVQYIKVLFFFKSRVDQPKSSVNITSCLWWIYLVSLSK